MEKLKKLFENYIDEVFPESPKPKFAEAIDCLEIPEFAGTPSRDDFGKVLKGSFDAFWWFSPAQFLYYLPALMKASVADFARFQLMVEKLFEVDETHDCFKIHEKWSQLSHSQNLAVRIWILILKSKTNDEDFQKNLSAASENLEIADFLNRGD